MFESQKGKPDKLVLWPTKEQYDENNKSSILKIYGLEGYVGVKPTKRENRRYEWHDFQSGLDGMLNSKAPVNKYIGEKVVDLVEMYDLKNNWKILFPFVDEFIAEVDKHTSLGFAALRETVTYPHIVEHANWRRMLNSIVSSLKSEAYGAFANGSRVH